MIVGFVRVEQCRHVLPELHVIRSYRKNKVFACDPSTERQRRGRGGAAGGAGAGRPNTIGNMALASLSIRSAVQSLVRLGLGMAR